ncbi:MAG: hypothetical protein PVG71_02845 [Anaerolineae bacterium]|jgi:hypothetical protein
MKPGTLAVIGLSAFLVAWYIAGRLYNRRRGQRVRRWLLAGLDVLGGEREEGWIGSPATGARINVTRAEPPFRRLEITFLLANREIPLLWLADHLRGRRDRVIIRATLRSPRRGEVRVGSGRRAERQEESWTWQEGPHGLTVGHAGRGAQRRASALQPWIETYGVHLDRFFWRKRDPHITLQAKIGGLLELSAATFLTDLSVALKANEKT